jgi:hypothetical protein
MQQTVFSRRLFALLVVSVLALPAHSQGVATPADLKRITDEVMKKVGRGDVEGGLRTMKPHLIVPEAEFDVLVGQARLQLPMMAQRFGESLDYELVREDRIGESFVRYVYVHRMEKHAMRWMFFCYRGKAGWVINTFRFDDKWHELF